jgi:MFS family permease
VRTARVFRAVLGNPDLRRVELAYAGFNASEFAVWIAMLVFAYGRGGTTEASFVAVLQLVPAAICAPFLALLADRHRPVRVLAGGYLAQAAGMAATAVAIVAHAPVPFIYAGAVVAATAVTITRPAQAVIVPSLARSAEELTATNVVSSWVESVGVLLASALTGVLLAVAGADLVFGLMAAVALASALLVTRVDGPEPPPAEGGASSRSEALAGFGALGEHRHLRLLIGMLMGEFLLWGALDILFVVLALDVLDLERGWVGYFNAAFGAGGIIGGLAAMILVGRRHLAPPIAIGVLMFGGAFVVIALWPSTVVAVLLLALSGAGRIVLDVGCRTLLQRTTPSEVLGRVFGVLEGLEMGALALGALLIPPLVALGGSKAALIGAGLLLPALALLMARPLIAVDRSTKVPVVEIALLRSMPIFAALPPPAIEGVARSLEPLELPAGTVVIHMGDEGDRFYAIAEGEVEVSRHGAVVALLARGAGFGEIALLEDVPRTATVTALTDVLLYGLDKAPFLTAVTGHAPAAQAASALVSKRRDELEQLSADHTSAGG